MGRLKMQKTESMEWIITEDTGASPSAEESNGDGNLVGSGTLKKGPWTPEEDKILEAYVTKNGEGNWNAVQKYSGLSRCGKSCRLRWANHLRPNLKKGAFTPEEEDLIIRLHAKLGNKWARMANQLPGRTDNEIKNFWNTRIKRLQRTGQSIYPADVEQSRKSSETQLSQVSGIFPSEVPLSQNFKEAKFEIPLFEMADSFSYLMNLPGIPTSNMLPPNLLPSRGFSNQLPTIHPQKRLRESDTSHGLRDTATSSLFSQETGNAFEMYHHQPYDSPGSYHGVGDPSLCFLPGSHALINGNCSTSEPDLGSVKLELPSFQSSELYSISGNFPPLEYNDTEVQFLQTEPCQVQSTCATDGLLESILCQPERVKSPEIETDLLDDFIQLPDPDSEWEWSLHGDLDEATLLSYGPVSEHTLDDEPQPTDNIITGHETNTSDADPHQHPPGNHVIEADRLDSSRPDALLNANLLSPDTEQGKQFLLYQEALSHLLEGPIYLQQPQPKPRQLEGFQGANSTVGVVVPSI